MGWDNDQYLKFKAQRTQPAIDLAARIPLEDPSEIIDVGCGPGNSSRVLKNRFPDAHVLGADSSENMLTRAREDNPDMDFVLLDAGGDMSGYDGRFDVVFSNACLQWVPEHRELLPKLFALLKEGGALAVQIPMNYDEPIHRTLTELTGSAEWRGKLGIPRLFHTLSQEEYFDVISRLTDDFEMWQTTYFHRMPDHAAIMDWYRATGMRPYLEALNERDSAEFERQVLERVQREYEVRENGEIIFRFPRFFFVAKKQPANSRAKSAQHRR